MFKRTDIIVLYSVLKGQEASKYRIMGQRAYLSLKYYSIKILLNGTFSVGFRQQIAAGIWIVYCEE